MTSDLKKDSKIFVAGHRGLVGSSVVRALQSRGYTQIITRTHQELDLKNLDAVSVFFKEVRPEYVILAAAKVGGIGANSKFPVEFLLENLQIQNAVISSSADFGIKKLIFLGSSCIYPKSAKYPLTEDQLLSGPFESTNEAYALAKVAGIKLCQAYADQYQKNFVSVMPTNLYGPHDFYDFEKSHVIPAMLLKFIKAKHEQAKSVTLWGTGQPFREFLYSDDLAAAIVLILEKYNETSTLINAGSEKEVSIRELAETIKTVTGFSGTIEWDGSKPDGTFRKIMDSSRLRALGWSAEVKLEEGLRKVLGDAEAKFLTLQRSPQMAKNA